MSTDTGDEWLEYVPSGLCDNIDGDSFAEYFNKQQISESKSKFSKSSDDAEMQFGHTTRSKKHATNADPYVYFDEAVAGSSQRRKRARNSAVNNMQDSDDDASSHLDGEKSATDSSEMSMGRMNSDMSREGKRLRRLIRNRLSAQLHRERKRVYVERLELEIQQRDQRISSLTQALNEKENENKVLQAKIDSLTQLQRISSKSTTATSPETILSDRDIDKLMESDEDSSGDSNGTSHDNDSSCDDSNSDKSFKLYSIILSPLLVWLFIVLSSFGSDNSTNTQSSSLSFQLVPYYHHHHHLRGSLDKPHPLLWHPSQAIKPPLDDDSKSMMIVCLDSVVHHHHVKSSSSSSHDNNLGTMVIKPPAMIQSENANRVFLVDSSSQSSQEQEQQRTIGSPDDANHSHVQPEITLKFVLRSDEVTGLLHEFQYQQQEELEGESWVELECLLLGIRNVVYSLQSK